MIKTARWWIVVIAGVCACMTFASEAMASRIGRFTSGPWHGSVYANDDTGAFSSCIAAAKYRSGITMLVMVTRDWDWELGFASSNWRMRKGTRVPLRYRFDRTRWRDAVAKVISRNTAVLPMPADGEVIRLFRRGRRMTIDDGERYYRFNLTGTSRLLADLADCVNTRLAREQSPGTDRSGTGVVQPEPRAQADVAQLELEGTRVLSNFLLAAGIKNAAIVSKDRAPASLRFAHAVAVAGTQSGFVDVIPAGGAVSPQQVVGDLLKGVSAACKGKFASGSSRELVQSHKVNTGFIVCRDSRGVGELRYVITERRNGGHYFIGLLDAGKPDSGTLSDAPGDKIDSVRLREAAYAASRQ